MEDHFTGQMRNFDFKTMSQTKTEIIRNRTNILLMCLMAVITV